MLYNDKSGKFMVVDLERAERHGREPLGLLSFNSRVRKRKRTKTIKLLAGVFAAERKTVRAELLLYQ